MIFEGVKALKHQVMKMLFPQIIPEVLHGVEFRRIGWKPHQANVIGNHK